MPYNALKYPKICDILDLSWFNHYQKYSSKIELNFPLNCSRLFPTRLLNWKIPRFLQAGSQRLFLSAFVKGGTQRFLIKKSRFLSFSLCQQKHDQLPIDLSVGNILGQLRWSELLLRRGWDPGGETDQPWQEGGWVPWGRRSFLFGGEAGVGWRRGGGRAEKSETFGGEENHVSWQLLILDTDFQK